jgi:hypothetical protein
MAAIRNELGGVVLRKCGRLVIPVSLDMTVFYGVAKQLVTRAGRKFGSTVSQFIVPE